MIPANGTEQFRVSDVTTWSHGLSGRDASLPRRMTATTAPALRETHPVTDDRLSLVHTFFERFFGGQVDDALQLLEPTVVYRVPGRSATSGDFEGPDAVAKHLRKFLELTGNAIDVLSWDDWLVGSTDIAGVVRVHLQRPGRTQDFRFVFLVEVSPNVLIARVEVFYSDPEAFERFFSW
jgi:ketosteroid isomerase-like protein